MFLEGAQAAFPGKNMYLQNMKGLVESQGRGTGFLGAVWTCGEIVLIIQRNFWYSFVLFIRWGE